MISRLFAFSVAGCLAANASLSQPFDAAAAAESLAGGDTAAIEEAREDAVRYLSQRRLSVSDRLAAEGALRDAIESAIESGDEFRTVNALLVAGYLVTPTSFQAIEPLLRDERPGVRYAAFKAMRDSMRVLGEQASPSLQPSAAGEAFERLAEAARSETDPTNIEAGLRALGAATTMRSDRMRALAERAQIEFSGTALTHLRGIDRNADDQAYRQSLGAVLIAVLDLRTLLSDRSLRIDEAAVRGAAELAGGVIQHVYEGFTEAGSIESIPESRRLMMAQAMTAGETLAFFAVSRLDSGVTATEVAADFSRGDDRSFRAGALRIISTLERNGIPTGGG
ncbi:MAG: hypothetical protein AAGF47_10645 [Planctomycetota bacterium]